MRIKVLIAMLLVVGVFLLNACQKEKNSSSVESDAISQESSTKQRETDAEETVVPVEALVIKNKVVEESVPLTGVFEPLNEVDIISEVSGKVKQITGQLGDPVTTRDTLAIIDDVIPLSHYRQAQSQVLTTDNNLKIAQLNLKSDEELLNTDDISQLEYENSLLAVKSAEANRLSAIAQLNLREKNYLDTRIVSSIKGLISRKYINLGTMVSVGMPLYRVVDLSVLKVRVSVPQSMIIHVNEGSHANVMVSALKNRVLSGVVKYISPQANESTGGFMVEVHVKNTKNLNIRAGMTAKVELTVIALGKQLAIPDYALITKNGEVSVYKIENNRARLTDITISETIGSQVVVSQGLVEGDTIVVVGMKNLGVDTKIWLETVH